MRKGKPEKNEKKREREREKNENKIKEFEFSEFISHGTSGCCCPFFFVKL